MVRKFIVIIIASLIFSVISFSAETDTYIKRMVEITGVGEVKVDPDIAQIYLVLQVTGAAAMEAMELYEKK